MSGVTVQELLAQLDVDGGVEALSEGALVAAQASLDEGSLKRLRFKAKTFIQGPNKNYLRFYDEDLPELAASYAGVPFLRDHDTSRIESRDGTVRTSEFQDGALVQEIELTTERGMRSFLEGQIDRFSIGWHYDGIKCSICGNEWLDAECRHWPGRKYVVGDGKGKTQGKATCELYFVRPRGKEVSAVNVPAVPGTGLLAQLCEQKEQMMKRNQGSLVTAEPEERDETTGGVDEVPTVAPAAASAAALPVAPALSQVPPAAVEQPRAQPQATPADTGQADAASAPVAGEWLKRMQAATLDARLATSGLSAAGQEAVRAQFGLHAQVEPETIERLIEVQRRVESSFAEPTVVRRLGPIALDIETEAERVQSVVDYCLGVPDAKTPPANLRSMRDLYLWVTGDDDFHGRWAGLNPSLAAATTQTLPALVVNALNKVLIQHYVDLAMYRWYEKITVPMIHDGTTQDVQLITLSGMTNLPVVPEGAAYTEKELSDRKVTATFSKYGAYIGITLEMIRKNDVARMQMIPREMMTAAIRTRSAAVASIFTQNSGAGPTMAYDSTALFHTNHGNLDTAAFDFTGWAAARVRTSKQAQMGSGARLGYLPRYALLPIDLYDLALNVFGYGAGYGGKPGVNTNDLNPYAEDRPGDPRPVAIVVPEFTDTTDWACIVDPKLVPVIQMAYANNPPGGKHPMPEIFTVQSETQGLMFSNDTMPIKIRDWWSLGVSSHVGIGKNNVAGG